MTLIEQPQSINGSADYHSFRPDHA